MAGGVMSVHAPPGYLSEREATREKDRCARFNEGDCVLTGYRSRRKSQRGWPE